jgi:hypothetical protein
VPEALTTHLFARVKLADHPVTPANLRIIDRPGWSRVLRSVVLALLIPPVALVAFLIPPHGEPFFLAIGLGVYFVYREATTRYVVQAFSGSCPRCGSALTLKKGSRLTAARRVPCYGCHFHPTIEVLPAENPTDTPIKF